MAEGGVSLSSDHFKCSLCLEDFKIPKLLTCFHTFCAPCLQTFIESNSLNNQFECPLCRTIIYIPATGVREFQTNFYIEAALEDEYVFHVSCDVCGPEFTAVNRCTDCAENVCQKCTETHAKMKVLRQHKLIELSAMDSNAKRKITSTVSCPDHPKYELVFVCKKCDKRLCIVCKLSSHESHPTSDIASEAKETREKLYSLINDQDVKNTIEELRAKIDNRVDLEKALKLSLTKEVKDIREQAKKMHRLVDELAEDAELKLTDIYQRDIDSIKEEIQRLRRDFTSATSTIDAAQLVLDHDCDAFIVQNGKILQNRICNIHNPIPTKLSDKVQNVFTPGKIDTTTLASAFVLSLTSCCNVIEVKPTKYHHLTSNNLKLISTIYVPNLSCIVTSIVPVNKDSAWVCCWEGQSVVLVDYAGQVIKTIDVGSYGRFVTTQQKLGTVVSCPSDKSIKRVKAVGIVEPFLTNLDMYPHGMACRISQDGSSELIVCCTNTDYGYNSTKGKILVVQESGHVSGPIATESKVPLSVATDLTSGKMCIADCQNNEVTIHDASGKLLTKYKDPDFAPRDVCFYNSDCILVANDATDLRAIRADGSDMNILMKKQCYSIAVHEERIWIGVGVAVNVGGIEVYDVV